MSNRLATPCVILGCSNSKPKISSSSKTFHKFPTDEVMRNRWDVALNGHKWVPVWIQEPRWRVCSDHFPASDFLQSGELHPEAAPSLLKRRSTVGTWYKDVKPKNYQSVKLKRAMVPRHSDSTSESFCDDARIQPRLDCCVIGCGETVRTKILLKIPKLGSLRKMWIDALKGHTSDLSWVPRVSALRIARVSELRVCLNHFTAKDFLADGEPHHEAVPTLLNRSLTGRWCKNPANSHNAITDDVNGSQNEGGNEMSNRSSNHQISTTNEPWLDLDSWKPKDRANACPADNFNPLEFVEVKLECESNSDSPKVPSSCQQDPEPSDLTIVETLEEASRSGSPVDPAMPPKLPRPLAYMSCSEVRTALCKVTSPNPPLL